MDTTMLLSREDITRLETLGYDPLEFSAMNDEGFFELRNVHGSCFFLKENQCQVYTSRPQGCKFYPIIFDLDINKAILDKECPLISTISSSTVTRFTSDLRKFIKLLLKEKDDRIY